MDKPTEEITLSPEEDAALDRAWDDMVEAEEDDAALDERAGLMADILGSLEEETEDQKEARRAARLVLLDTLSRMFTKESNAATRAAKDPTFDTWLQEWYDRHQQTLTDALAPAAAVLQAAGVDVEAPCLAANLVHQSRAELRQNYDTLTPAQFAARLQTWPTGRARLTADAILAEPERWCCGGPGSGVPGPCPEGDKEKDKEPEQHHFGANTDLPDQSRPPLTYAEHDAVVYYSSGGYYDLNRALREGKPLTGELATLKQNLDNALGKTQPFEKPVQVVRGLTLRGQEVKDFIGLMQSAQRAGRPVELYGMQSTTTLKNLATFPGNVKLEITAHRGLDVKPHAAIPRENELLLPHGSEFRITSVKKGWFGGYRVKMEQVNYGERQAAKVALLWSKRMETPTKDEGQEMDWDKFVDKDATAFHFPADLPAWDGPEPETEEKPEDA